MKTFNQIILNKILCLHWKEINYFLGYHYFCYLVGVEFSGFTMLCWFLLYCKVNQPHVYIYPLFFGFPSYLGHHRAPSRVFWAVQFALISYLFYSSVQFSRSVMSDSLRPHEPQHARPPCPSPTPESTHTHVHWVGDAIQPCHSLSSPSPAFSLSQHQGLFKWVSSLHQVAKLLEFQLQHPSFQWTPKTDFL